MKISNQMNIQNMLKTYGKSVNKAESKDKVSFKNDKVEISSEARDIQVAMKALNDVPEIRSEKLNQIKELMASGNYKPSAEDIADKILSGVGYRKN